MRKGTYNLSEKELNKQGVGQKARRLVKGGISNTEFVRGKGVVNKATGKPLTGTVMVDGRLLRYKDGKRVTTSGIGMAAAKARKPGSTNVSPASSAGRTQGATSASDAKPGSKVRISPTERRMKQGKSTPTGGVAPVRKATPATGTPTGGYRRSATGRENLRTALEVQQQRARERRRIAKGRRARQLGKPSGPYGR